MVWREAHHGGTPLDEYWEISYKISCETTLNPTYNVEMTIKPYQNVVHLCLRCHKQVRTDTKNKLKIHCRCDDKIEPAGKLNGERSPRSGIATLSPRVQGKRMPPA